MIYDIQWKKIITRLAGQFLLFFFPDLAKNVDPNGEIEFVQQEFFPVVKGKHPSFRRVDLILKIPLNNGKYTYCLLHIEAQTRNSAKLRARMFKYYLDIHTRYPNVPIAALALLTEGTSDKTTDTFEIDFHGTGLKYWYNVYNVMAQSEEELLANDNPFALVVLAMKRRRKVRNEVEKLLFRKELIVLLQERNYTEEEISVLQELISQLFIFDDPNQEEDFMRVKGGFTAEDEELEKQLVRKTRPSTYRFGVKDGIEQGIEQGIERGRSVAIYNMIPTLRAEGLSAEAISRITELPLSEVEAILSSSQ